MAGGLRRGSPKAMHLTSEGEGCDCFYRAGCGSSSLGAIGQVNLGFEAGGKKPGHLCGLELGAWPQDGHFTDLNFVCLLCSVCSSVLEEDG